MLKMIAVAGLLVLGAAGSAAGATPYGFNVRVTLTPKAAARVAAAHKQVEVVVFYEGEPGPGQDRHADDTTGQIDVGTERILLPGAGGVAVVTGNAVNPARLKWVKPGSLQMYANINPPIPTNVQLICLPLPFGNLPAVAGRTFDVTCKLQGE